MKDQIQLGIQSKDDNLTFLMSQYASQRSFWQAVAIVEFLRVLASLAEGSEAKRYEGMLAIWEYISANQEKKFAKKDRGWRLSIMSLTPGPRKQKLAMGF